MYIGIDLGTTNSCISHLNRDGVASIIPSSEGGNIIPSVVTILKDEVVVGEVAKKEYLENKENTFIFAKRYMDNPGACTIKIEDKNYDCVEASAFILRKIKQDAELFMNESVEGAVITVPAYFDTAAKKNTLKAAEIAGLNVAQLVMEPSAAAINYMYEKKKAKKRIAVFDLGGGTFDISVVDVDNFEAKVVATGGDPRLGGKDIDEAVGDIILKSHNKDSSSISISAKAEIIETSEYIKKILTAKNSTKYKLRELGLEGVIEKIEFEDKISNLVEECLSHVRSVFDEIEDGVGVDEFLLVGGSTRSPIFEEKISKEFGIPVNKFSNPDVVVAQGAAILAAKTAGVVLGSDERTSDLKSIKFEDIVPHSIGFIYSDSSEGGALKNKILIKKGSMIPCKEITEGYYFEGNTVEHKITQGESVDADLVEVIGKLIIDKEKISGSLKSDEQVKTSVSIELTYTEKGDIESVVKDLTTGKNFKIEITSENIKTKEQVEASKRDVDNKNMY